MGPAGSIRAAQEFSEGVPGAECWRIIPLCVTGLLVLNLKKRSVSSFSTIRNSFVIDHYFLNNGMIYLLDCLLAVQI